MVEVQYRCAPTLYAVIARERSLRLKQSAPKGRLLRQDVATSTQTRADNRNDDIIDW